jgi:hypothetical protein
MMKVTIILYGPGDRWRDRQTIDVEEDAATASESILQAMKAWTLAAGDTVKIKEA